MTTYILRGQVKLAIFEPPPPLRRHNSQMAPYILKNNDFKKYYANATIYFLEKNFAHENIKTSKVAYLWQFGFFSSFFSAALTSQNCQIEKYVAQDLKIPLSATL